ncbi:hypothetical protein BGW37DRAFT_532535 [Umbelopsis sp. PMI_123]|nr:hypothetical protein BGW37DRAFT_532535 [Umbelopsis sp. PMI_123]
MVEVIADIIAHCPQCQLAQGAGKATHHAPIVPRDAVPPFARWHMDFIGEFPIHCTVAVDSATNWPISRALPEATGAAFATFLHEEITMRFHLILSDRGPNFITFNCVSPAPTENVRDLMVLSSKCSENTVQGQYVAWMSSSTDPFSQHAFEHIAQQVNGAPPFSRPPKPSDLRPQVEVRAQKLEELGRLREAAEQRSRVVSTADKERWDAKIEPKIFDVGDHVLIRHENKFGLEFNWFGPFKVIQRNLATGIYKLEHLDGSAYSTWVHTDKLIKARAEDISEPWNDPTTSRAKRAQ